MSVAAIRQNAHRITVHYVHSITIHGVCSIELIINFVDNNNNIIILWLWVCLHKARMR